MKIHDLSPMVTKFHTNKVLRASSWRTVDRMDGEFPVREIYHYETLMGEFVAHDDDETWFFAPKTVGLGSVSDQNGMRILAESVGSTVRMKRDGGKARYVNTVSGRVLATDGNA